jgi:hypothetical protein
MTSTTFNIKVTIDVEPVQPSQQTEKPKETTSINLKDFNRFKEWYCDVCDSKMSLVSSYSHVKSKYHLKRLAKKN